MTGTMAKLGAALPRGLMPADSGNERGYFEPKRLAQFNDRLLSLGGSSWVDWRKFAPQLIAAPPAAVIREAENLLLEEFGSAPLFVFKDPRMCRLVPFWRPIFENLGITPRVVLPFRSPLEVALSLQARHNVSVERGLLLWIRHVIDAERDSRDWPRCFVPMDDFLTDWRNWAQRIACAIEVVWPGLDDSATIEEIDQFLSPQLKHYNVEFADEGVGAGWVKPLYKSCLLLAQNSNSSLARVTWDDVSNSFETACSLVGPDFVTLEASNVQLHRDIAAFVEARAAVFNDQRPSARGVHEMREEWGIYSLSNTYNKLRTRTGQVREVLEEVRTALTNTR